MLIFSLLLRIFHLVIGYLFSSTLTTPARENHSLDLNLSIAPPEESPWQSHNMETGSFQINAGSNILLVSQLKVQRILGYGVICCIILPLHLRNYGDAFSHHTFHLHVQGSASASAAAQLSHDPRTVSEYPIIWRGGDAFLHPVYTVLINAASVTSLIPFRHQNNFISNASYFISSISLFI